MTKVYVVMFNDVAKFATLTLEAAEKVVKHQQMIWGNRPPPGGTPIVWIKEVGEEPIKTEVQWWVISEAGFLDGSTEVNARTRSEARRLISTMKVYYPNEVFTLERREYALMKKETVS